MNRAGATRKACNHARDRPPSRRRATNVLSLAGLARERQVVRAAIFVDDRARAADWRRRPPRRATRATATMPIGLVSTRTTGRSCGSISSRGSDAISVPRRRARRASTRQRKATNVPSSARGSPSGRSNEKCLQLASSSGPTSSRSRNSSSSSQIGTCQLRISPYGRPAEQALAADELRRDIHPIRIATDLHEHGRAVTAAVQALDPTGDPPATLRLGLVERDRKPRASCGGSMPRNLSSSGTLVTSDTPQRSTQARALQRLAEAPRWSTVGRGTGGDAPKRPPPGIAAGGGVRPPRGRTCPRRRSVASTIVCRPTPSRQPSEEDRRAR